jgi:hypothetical protein
MRIRTLGIAAAIISTLGFSCYNEPNYPREGMSNGPGGAGSGTMPPPPSTAVGASAASPAPAAPTPAGTSATKMGS